ncbi:MAG TPA: GNAT family N-acetyltransferase [Gemmatimonadaceae bacterium]|nr:GNAT family N-acetyltransferase [Gemmatimonadaceae bacterium]
MDASAAEELTVRSVTFFETALTDGAYVAWVAAPLEQPTLLVAGGGAQRRKLLPRPDHAHPDRVVDEEALIVNIYTDPAWRRRGIAVLVMHAILGWTQAEGITRVVLHASAAGRSMYERLGFVANNEMRYESR